MRAVGALAVLIMTALVARKLGAGESGLFFLGYSVVAVLAAVSRVGMGNTLIRYVAAYPEFRRELFFKSLFVSSVFSIGVSLFIYLYSDYIANSMFNKPEFASVLSSISLSIIGIAVTTLSANAIQGLGKVSVAIFFMNILINAMLIIRVLVYPVDSAEGIATYYSEVALLSSIISIICYLSLTSVSESSSISWNKILSSCIPLWIVVIMQQLLQWSGQFFAGVYLDSATVAQLAVSQRSAMLVSFVLIAINAVVAPKFAELYKNNKMAELENLAKKSVRVIAFFAMPIFMILMVFPVLVLGFFGEEFVSGALYLRILVCGQFVNAITGSVGLLLMMSGHEKDMRNIAFFSGGVSLMFAFILTNTFGAIGNAVGTALAVGAQNLLAAYYVKRRLGFSVLKII